MGFRGNERGNEVEHPAESGPVAETIHEGLEI